MPHTQELEVKQHAAQLMISYPKSSLENTMVAYQHACTQATDMEGSHRRMSPGLAMQLYFYSILKNVVLQELWFTHSCGVDEAQVL